MVTAAPTPKLPMDRTAPHESPLAQRPGVKATLRALNLVGGLVFSALAFVVVGLAAALTGCLGGETSGLCAGHPELVPVLEWPIFLVAVLAPLAGGVAAFAQRRPRWLALGVGLAVVMFVLMLAVSHGQTGVLS